MKKSTFSHIWWYIYFSWIKKITKSQKQKEKEKKRKTRTKAFYIYIIDMSDKATLREPLIADEENSQRQQRMSGVSRTHSRSDEANFYGYYNGFDETLYYKSEEDSLESKRNRDGPFYCCCCFSCKSIHYLQYILI